MSTTRNYALFSTLDYLSEKFPSVRGWTYMTEGDAIYEYSYTYYYPLDGIMYFYVSIDICEAMLISMFMLLAASLLILFLRILRS